MVFIVRYRCNKDLLDDCERRLEIIDRSSKIEGTFRALIGLLEQFCCCWIRASSDGKEMSRCLVADEEIGPPMDSLIMNISRT
jgi:hypothetical protein